MRLSTELRDFLSAAARYAVVGGAIARACGKDGDELRCTAPVSFYISIASVVLTIQDALRERGRVLPMTTTCLSVQSNE